MRNDRWMDARRFEISQARNKENSARQASCYVTFAVFGAGEIIVNSAESFHTPFLGEPSVSFGFDLKVSPNLDAYLLPRVSGGVFRWAIEGKDRYVGMFPYFTVDIDQRDPNADPATLPTLDGVEITAHLTFTGLSFKAMGETVPAKLADAAIPPRKVPFKP